MTKGRIVTTIAVALLFVGSLAPSWPPLTWTAS